MNTPNVHAGRLERRVRQVDRDTVSDIHGFCSLLPFGAICDKPLLRLYCFTSLKISRSYLYNTKNSPIYSIGISEVVIDVNFYLFT